MIYLGVTKVDQAKKDRLLEALGFLNTFLDGHKYVAGDQLTLADLSCLASVTSIDVSSHRTSSSRKQATYHDCFYISQNLGIDLSQFPNISEWYERCKSLPGWQECDQGAKKFAGQALRNLEEKKL